MAGESNADVYASFGVNSAVLTGDSPTQHEQNMLELDVAARDGDDSIELSTEDFSFNNDDPYGSPDPFGEQDENRMQVRISADGDDPEADNDDTDSDETDSEQSVDAERPEGEAEDFEFTEIGETPKDITSASEQLEAHEQGFNEMVSTAISRGLTEDAVSRIQSEYQSDEGLTEASYAELAEAGYSKSFVDSYIRGQEALVNQYVDQVMNLVGGRETFNRVYSHLQTTNADAANSLMEAFESRNVGTLKAIMNLAGTSYAKTFGKPAARTLTKVAKQAGPKAVKVEGFESQGEMIKAMSDPRYRSDTKYRQEVEQKVINSNF